MTALFACLGIWIAGAAAAWWVRRRTVLAATLGVGSAVSGALAGLAAALPALLGAEPAYWRAAWTVPYGALSLRVDPLAAVFLIPVCVVGAAGALYGAGYLRRYAPARPLGAGLAGWNLLLASMALVTTASNLVLFLVAWELMTLASWALVVTDHESRAVRGAGFVYLVASQLATGALLLLFLMIGPDSGWEIGTLRVAAPAGWLFALALVGFGTKAGVVPFHVWLPEAHAAAPAHVSGLMSGVLISMGFYGLARFVPMLAPASPVPGGVLMALGALGALGAILLALLQRDVKRVLAYSTVENAGLVSLAMGVALLGDALGQPRVAMLGWCAALLHLWNHALCKTLLFQGLGAVAQAAHDRDLESWGGVLRRWPATGALILTGSLAIAALPGLNAFVSEWLLLRALLQGALDLHGAARGAMLLGLAALTLTAALAIACYARLVGIGLLGEPRGEAIAHLPRQQGTLLIPMALLAVLCVLAAWFPATLVAGLARPLAMLVPAGDAAAVVEAVSPLASLALAVVGAVAVLAMLRRALGRGGRVRKAVTWDCGFLRTSPRMQYTGASLVEPIGRAFAGLLRTRIERAGPAGHFPATASWRSRTLDPAVTEMYRPALERLAGLMTRVRDLQEPHVTTYLRWVVLALLVALALLFLPVRIPFVVRP